MWWKRLIEAFRAWRSRRRYGSVSIPVPDLLEIHLEDARHAVQLEKERQRLIEAKTKTARMKAEAKSK